MNYTNFKYIFKKFNTYNSSKLLKFSKNFTFIGIFMGTMALIISLTVLEGFQKVLYDKAVNFSSHINIISFKRDFLPNSDSVLIQLKQHPDISEVYPIISSKVIIRSKKSINGIELKGISPEYQKKISKILNEDYSPLKQNEVIISQLYAEKNNIKINDKIIVYRVKIKNNLQTSVTSLIVKGFFHSGFGKYDFNFAFISDKKAKAFFKVPNNSVSSYEVYLKNPDLAPKISLELDKILGYPFYSQSVFQIHSQMFAWIEIQKTPIPIILGVISIIALLNIITSLLVNVIEKNKSIGILRGMGLKSSTIKMIFIGKGMYVTIKATILSMIFSYLILLAQKEFQLIKLDSKAYFIDQVPVDFKIEHFVIVFFATIIFALLSSYIPARIATKVNPIKVLKFD